jgi:hypothetical protein
MICLSCGFCCKTMSPINGGYCPLLKNEGDVYYCSDYENRPIECANHTIPTNVCTIGKLELNIKTEEQVKERIIKVRNIIRIK